MIWVSEKASRLNADDKIDFSALAEQAKCNGGSAWSFIYVGEVVGDDVFIRTIAEKIESVENGE